jgi:hypothetical protein
MADYSDFEELDLTGLNVDHVTPRRSILTADYGHGYKDTTRVGPGRRDASVRSICRRVAG